MATVPSEELAATALCTDEDVRAYLGIKPDDLSADDRNTLIRLVNAASELFTDESQRIWKPDPAYAGMPRLYRADRFDLETGRLRIDDCTAVATVSYGDFRTNVPTVMTGWYAWQDEPGYPITAVAWSLNSIPIAGGWYYGNIVYPPNYVFTVDASWGWPRVPEPVRQAVIYTAAEWYARDVEKFSATFSIDQGRILLPQVLPNQVQRMAENYRRWRVA